MGSHGLRCTPSQTAGAAPAGCLFGRKAPSWVLLRGCRICIGEPIMSMIDGSLPFLPHRDSGLRVWLLA